MKIKDYRGVDIIVYPRLFDHVERRHPDVLQVLNIRNKYDLYDVLKNILGGPHEVYKDREGTYYYIRRLNDIFITAIVYDNVVRTMYLLSNKNYCRMRSKRWVYKVY